MRCVPITVSIGKFVWEFSGEMRITWQLTLSQQIPNLAIYIGKNGYFSILGRQPVERCIFLLLQYFHFICIKCKLHVLFMKISISKNTNPWLQKKNHPCLAGWQFLHFTPHISHISKFVDLALLITHKFDKNLVNRLNNNQSLSSILSMQS